MIKPSQHGPSNRGLRVLIDLRPVRTPISGVARYCIELVKALSACEDAPHVAGLFYGTRESNAGLRATTQLDGVPSVSNARPKVLMAGLEFAPLVGQFLIHGTHDLVHETYFANIAERSGCPKVATIHDVIPIESPEYASRRNRYFSRKNLFRQARQARRIICVSEYSKRKVVELTGIDPARITVIPNGVTTLPAQVDRNFINDKGLAGKRFFLFVGNVEPRKNLVLVAEALARLQGSDNDTLFVVAGHMNYLAQPIIDCCKAVLGPRFIHLGSVTEEQKTALLESAMALVFPSLSEGFGIPVVEAYHAGCPVVLANNTALSELAVDARQLFDAASVEDLQGRLREVTSGASWVAHSITTAASGLERFSWASIARQTLVVYRNALES